MLYVWLARLILVVHLAFVAFVVLGGLLALARPRLAWIHVPAALWGSWVELSGAVCPLTPLENHLLALGGAQGYAGGFLERYLLAVVYPSGLSRGDQLALGLAALGVNVAIYGFVIARRRRKR